MKKNSTKTPARIAAYCHEGRDLKDATDNKSRLAVLDRIADALLSNPSWHPLDAVLLPGGFLSEVPDKSAAKFIKKLEHLSPGIHLIVGVDTKGEQLALAFNSHGLAGSARKIFPVGEDVDGKTMAPITLHERDFSDKNRFVQLPSGNKALLCVCYDMFGFSDTVRKKTARLDKAVLVEDAEGHLYKGKGKGRSVLTKAFAAHQEMIAAEKPDIALATIHRFAGAGRENFWQRHGIATASAALKSGLALAAAHFGKLPTNLKSATLAANKVPPAHLKAGMYRQAHILPSDVEIVVKTAKEKGLLRLFKP